MTGSEDKKTIQTKPYLFSVGSSMTYGTMGMLLSQALILPTGLISAVYLARSLGASEYGIFSLAVVIVSTIEFLLLDFFARPTIKFVSESKQWQDIVASIIRWHLVVGLSVGGILFSCSLLLQFLTADSLLWTSLQLLALEIPLFLFFGVNRAILIGTGRYLQEAQSYAAYILSRLVFIILLVEVGLGVAGAVLGTIAASATGLMVSTWHVRPRMRSTFSFSWKELCAYGRPLFFSGLNLRFLFLDVVLLKVFGLPNHVVGWYSAARNISIVPQLFVVILARAMLSATSRLLSEGRKEMADGIIRQTLRVAFCFFPCIGILIGASGEIVALVYGNEFGSAASLLQVLLIGILPLALIGIIESVLVALGRPGLIVRITTSMLLLAACGYYFLIPSWGGHGGALTTATVSVLGMIAALVQTHKLVSLNTLFPTLLRTVFVTIVLTVCSSFWITSGAWVLVKLSVLGACSFFFLILLGELSAADKNFFRFLLKRSGETGAVG